MSETKYHTSRNGFLTKCSATKRACPLGGTHYTQEQYDRLASENDHTVRPTVVKHDPDSYYGKAHAEYVASVQRLKRFDDATKEAEKLQQSLLKEHGMKDVNLYQSKEDTRKSLEEALLYARDVYVEEGVSYGKAAFIIQDMKANTADPTKPITKRRDSMDSEIAAKTKNAKERLNEDSKYSDLTKAYGEAVRKDRLTNDIFTKVANFRSNLIRTTDAQGMPNIGAQKALERAKTWLKAGIAPSAREVSTTSVTPAQVSIDNKGKINNVWVETSNGIEKVVGYRDAKYDRSSGALITEKGTEVSSFTHYHSYKAESGGIKNVIISDKNGPSYPAESFSLYTSWDSGD